MDSIINENSKTAIFIIQVDMCGSCTEEKKEEMCAYAVEKDYSLVVILSKFRQDIEDKLSSCTSDYLILKDYDQNLTRYGLRFTENLILRYEN